MQDDSSVYFEGAYIAKSPQISFKIRAGKKLKLTPNCLLVKGTDIEQELIQTRWNTKMAASLLEQLPTGPLIQLNLNGVKS